ncbi:hypothetical protein Dda_9297 [Drechslerella dactyloides]|uniref:PEBP-like protein n=1 Tax=Drechslerella dactyloides TaxID=74499 RepID=A0AAD6IPP8_DREDA|nr:hypothetical protein Dda_9297 [Drechslerella dactyloides]
MKYLAVFLALAGPALAQTPPNFSPDTPSFLPIAYRGSQSNPSFFTNGGIFAKNAVQNEPNVYIPSSMANQTFLVLMVDPDAPSPRENSISQILHWLQPGARAIPNAAVDIRRQDGSTVTLFQLDMTARAIAPYRGPSPPSQEPHRYIFMLFAQRNGTFAMPESFQQFEGGRVRQKFDAKAFAQAAGLGSPMLGNFLLVGSRTTGDGSQTAGTNGFDVLELDTASSTGMWPNSTATGAWGSIPSSTSASSWTTTAAMALVTDPAFAQRTNASAVSFPTPSATKSSGGVRIVGSSLSLIVAAFAAWFIL